MHHRFWLQLLLPFLAIPLLVACERRTVPSEASARDSSEATPQLDRGKRYAVGAATVNYYDPQFGRRQVLYFRDYGAEQALYDLPADTTSDTSAQRAMVFSRGRLITYDPVARTGFTDSIPLPDGPMIGAIIPAWRMKQELQSKLKFRRLGKRTFLGNTATGYAYDDGIGETRVWVWKEIPLFLEIPVFRASHNLSYLVLEARSVDTSAIPADALFAIPSTIRLSASDSLPMRKR